ncbi:hypothetical protein D3C79_851750 [compost metagenome]
MPQQNQLTEARIGLEFMTPGHGIGDIAFNRQVAFIRCRCLAGGNAALVITHAGNAVLGQHQGQLPKVVGVGAVRAVAVAVSGPGAGDDQHHRWRLFGARQQQAAVQRAATGIETDRALQYSRGASVHQTAEQQGDYHENAQHHQATIEELAF